MEAPKGTRRTLAPEPPCAGRRDHFRLLSLDGPAPTYLESARLAAPKEPVMLVCGAHVNIPDPCALAEVVKCLHTFHMRVISLGTGSSTRATAHHEVKD